ncbi:MAG: zf-HC2 domain-containing protein [Nitrospinae bacterium]|nr:zf-HC2 domain-containing protein [Nitrospinota bacterium]MBI3813458.1 zf-HC2 domain-containing protein [Nitrospinota bacterium]
MFFKTDCKSVNQYISAILDGELKGRKADRVKNHIAGCERCRKELEIVKLSKSLSGEAEKEKSPFYLKNRIIGLIEERERKESFIERFFPFTPLEISIPYRKSEVKAPSFLTGFTLKHVYTASAVAALVLLVIVPMYYFSDRVSASPIAVKSVNNHLNNTIVDIFDGQMPSGSTELSREFEVPGLSWQGIGSPQVNLRYLKERRVAYIAFDKNGHKLSLFIFDINNLKLPEGRIIKEGDKEIFIETFKGFNVLFWREGNMGYSMVSDLGGDEMIRFMKYGEGYINQIQKNIESGTFFE